MTHDTFDYRGYIREQGYRITSQREAVVEAMCSASKHYVTPEQVYRSVQQADTSIDRSTVYRTLDFLTQIGLVAQSDINGNSMYELVMGRHPHHHLLCIDCGVEIEMDDELLNPIFVTLSDKYGFKFGEHNHLLIKGKCPACADSG